MLRGTAGGRKGGQGCLPEAGGREARGHSIAGLLEGLQTRVDVVEELLECGWVLDRFYIPERYPNSWAEGAPNEYYSQDEANRAIACADRVLRFCHGLLAGQG